MREGNMRRFIKISLAVLVLTTLAWASNPWKDKPYQQWDQKDVAKVLNDSPWSRTVSVSANWESSGMPGARTRMGTGQQMPGMGGGGQSGMGAPTRPGQQPGMQMPMRRDAKFQARWLSSRTMRKALARLEILKGKLKQPDAERYVAQEPAEYEVVIFGPDMKPFSSMKEAALKKEISLKAKKTKKEVTADGIKLQRSADGKRLLAVTIHFPKSAEGKPVIGAKEKEIDVVCRLKDTTLKFHFDPRKMKDKQGTDL
jgi:hypothetical protein